MIGQGRMEVRNGREWNRINNNKKTTVSHDVSRNVSNTELSIMARGSSRRRDSRCGGSGISSGILLVMVSITVMMGSNGSSGNGSDSK